VAISLIARVGSSILRRMVVGEEERAPTGEEMGELRGILARALEQGVGGSPRA